MRAPLYSEDRALSDRLDVALSATVLMIPGPGLRDLALDAALLSESLLLFLRWGPCDGIPPVCHGSRLLSRAKAAHPRQARLDPTGPDSQISYLSRFE